MKQLQEFHYRVAWRSHSALPGHHHSTQSGGGFEFYGHTPLINSPDARRLDIRASLHDPYGQFVVKTFRQRSAIPVFVVADLSASMGFTSTQTKISTLADFSFSVAYAALQTGDRFGFIGSDSQILWDFFLPLRSYKDSATEFMSKLSGFSPTGKGVEGLLDSVHYLGRKRALVFLVSDFHFSLESLNSILDALNNHDVVPVVLWDSAEFQELPRWGIARLQDPESGQTRSLFMRPALRHKIETAFAQRRRQLIEHCLKQGREPFFIVDQFEADALTRYFAFH